MGKGAAKRAVDACVPSKQPTTETPPTISPSATSVPAHIENPFSTNVIDESGWPSRSKVQQTVSSPSSSRSCSTIRAKAVPLLTSVAVEPRRRWPARFRPSLASSLFFHPLRSFLLLLLLLLLFLSLFFRRVLGYQAGCGRRLSVDRMLRFHLSGMSAVPAARPVKRQGV